MSSLDQIFEEYIKDENLGKVYYANNTILNKVKINFNTALKVQMINKNLPKANLYITNQVDLFKVFTFKKSDNYFIGISLGAIESIYRFFMFLYSQPFFDRTTGNPNLENEQTLNTSFKADYKYQYFLSEEINYEPICVIRRGAAFKSFCKAINYLLLHEYAHITHGHLDYFSKGKLNYMYFEKQELLIEKANIRKALEYDADSAATVQSLKDDTIYLLFGDSYFNEHNLKLELKSLNFAVYFLHKLTELKALSFDDYEYSTHPFSSQRMSYHLYLTATVLQMYKEEKDLMISVEDIIQSSGMEVLEIALLAHSKLFNEDILDDGLFYFNSNQGTRLTNTIRSSWNEIVENLQKYSYVKLADKNQIFNEEDSYNYEDVLKAKRDKNVDSSGDI